MRLGADEGGGFGLEVLRGATGGMPARSSVNSVVGPTWRARSTSSRRAVAKGLRRYLERAPNQREDPLVMQDVMQLGIVDQMTADVRAGSKSGQQECMGRLPNSRPEADRKVIKRRSRRRT
jgi:hypothetical protein